MTGFDPRYKPSGYSERDVDWSEFEQADPEEDRRLRRLANRGVKTTMLSFRISPADRDRVASLARKAGMSQSDFMIAMSLGEREQDQPEFVARLVRIEKRVARLERKAYGIELSDEEVDALE